MLDFKRTQNTTQHGKQKASSKSAFKALLRSGANDENTILISVPQWRRPLKTQAARCSSSGRTVSRFQISFCPDSYRKRNHDNGKRC